MIPERREMRGKLRASLRRSPCLFSRVKYSLNCAEMEGCMSAATFEGIIAWCSHFFLFFKSFISKELLCLSGLWCFGVDDHDCKMHKRANKWRRTKGALHLDWRLSLSILKKLHFPFPKAGVTMGIKDAHYCFNSNKDSNVWKYSFIVAQWRKI